MVPFKIHAIRFYNSGEDILAISDELHLMHLVVGKTPVHAKLDLGSKDLVVFDDKPCQLHN